MNARDRRRRARCGEHIAPREEAEALQLGPIRHAEAAHAAERLRERSDDEVGVGENALRLRPAQTARTVGAERVRLVHHQIGPVLVAGRDDLLERRGVAPDGVHALHDNQAIPPPTRQSRQLPREVLGGVVVEGERRRAREPGRVEDARVAIGVHEQDVSGSAEPGDDGEVRLIAGREDDRGALAEVGGERALQRGVYRERAVGGSRPRGSDAVAVDGFPRCCAHLRVEGQAEVVVRSEHEGPASPDDDLGGAQHLVDGRVARTGAVSLERRSARRERAQLVEQVCAGGTRPDHPGSCRLRSRVRE